MLRRDSSNTSIYLAVELINFTRRHELSDFIRKKENSSEAFAVLIVFDLVEALIYIIKDHILPQIKVNISTMKKA